MFWVLVLWSFIVLSGDGIISGAASRPKNINVGAIFSLGTLQGDVSNIAMKAAEEDVNSDPSFLRGSKLRIIMNNAKRNGFLSIMGALDPSLSPLQFPFFVHDMWLSRSNCSNLDGSESEEDSEQLKLRSFWGLFLLCGVACFVALFVYFIKIIREFTAKASLRKKL